MHGHGHQALGAQQLVLLEMRRRKAESEHLAAEIATKRRRLDALLREHESLTQVVHEQQHTLNDLLTPDHPPSQHRDTTALHQPANASHDPGGRRLGK